MSPQLRAARKDVADAQLISLTFAESFEEGPANEVWDVEMVAVGRRISENG